MITEIRYLWFMKSVELKSNLHQLIDGIQNTKLLESIHEILSARKHSKAGSLWNDLTNEQKKEVLDAYEESENTDNLIPHSQMLHDIK